MTAFVKIAALFTLNAIEKGSCMFPCSWKTSNS